MYWRKSREDKKFKGGWVSTGSNYPSISSVRMAKRPSKQAFPVLNLPRKSPMKRALILRSPLEPETTVRWLASMKYSELVGLLPLIQYRDRNIEREREK